MTQLKTIRQQCVCPVYLDDVTRHLYATDASIYQVTPKGVAFPRTLEETAEVMAAATAAAVPIIPRGAGSGLAGAVLGDGLVLDLCRYNRFITDFNPDARTVRVGAGVVLDQLNDFLAPHGLTFGPDVATSSRATLGGMIANNSSGARAPRYGTTSDHVVSLEVVTADGVTAILNADSTDWRDRLGDTEARVMAQRTEIQTRFHDGICKRWPGYGLDRFLRSIDHGRSDPATLVGGSEGTLCTVYAATLRVMPLPPDTRLLLFFFDSAQEALQASVELLDLEPAGIEHIDDILFDQTRGQRAFQAARDLLQLEERPCRAILLVEFHEHSDDKVDAALQRKLGTRHLVCDTTQKEALVWHLRKAGLSLLMGCPGSAKPTAGIEDVAVAPRKLPAYVEALRSVMNRLNLKASFYGHAASGLLHVRPVLDLHTAEDIRKFRELAGEVSALTRQFKGSLTAEHGVGIARTEFVAEHIGAELLETMQHIKDTFDPNGVMNPGKIFDNGQWRCDHHLRQGPGAAIPVPFAPMLRFEAKDHSFVGNLEQCNGCAGCRKDAPTMCPTFQATGDELMSTRGRANLIRAVLEGRLNGNGAPLRSKALDQALSNCLACKACTAECPSNVNMALLKAELLHARYEKHGAPIAARLLSRVDLLGRLGSTLPRLSNAMLAAQPFRKLLEALVGVAAERPLPSYALQRFDAWFHSRPEAHTPSRGIVLLWDDCFVRHNDPHIGRAAVAVLEAAGFAVRLVEGRACCGRPAFSMGRLAVARRFGAQNLRLLRDSDYPIVFLEPSCYAMFREEYSELGLDGAKQIAERTVLFEHFIEGLLRQTPEALSFSKNKGGLAVHVHCHAKSMTDTSAMLQLAQRVADNNAQLLDSGCCGMAGAFGALKEKYALSIEVSRELVQIIDTLPEDTRLVASGASCRHQIAHCTQRPAAHFAEVIADALDTPPEPDKTESGTTSL